MSQQVEKADAAGTEMSKQVEKADKAAVKAAIQKMSKQVEQQDAAAAFSRNLAEWPFAWMAACRLSGVAAVLRVLRVSQRSSQGLGASRQ